MTPEQTLAAEKTFSINIANKYLDDENLRTFLDGRFSNKFRVWANREFLTYTVTAGKVCPIAGFRSVDMQLNFQDGLGVFFERDDGKEFCVSHAPVTLADSVFIWAPKFPTVERAVMPDGTGSTSVLMALRLKHNHNRLVEGATYFDDRVSFQGLLNAK